MPKQNLAALDIGTNSFHLIIARVNDDKSFKVIERKREVLRIASKSADGRKIISGDELKKAVEVLKEFKKTADAYDAEIKTVATSSVREAENRDEFISVVYKKTGIRIEVIDGSEEAKLIFLGASGALDLKGQDVFCFDIGGGSTELILRKNNKFVFAESLPLGAVRLSNMFLPGYILDDKRIKDCEEYILKTFSSNPKLALYEKVKINVGTSGTVQSAVLLSHSVISNLSPDKMNGYKLTYDELLHVVKEVMQKKTVEERKTIKGMEAKRADIIPAGFLILKAVFEQFDLDTLVFSDYALREGLILSQL